MFDAFGDVGIDARPVIHRDEVAAETQAALDEVDGCWSVDPVSPSEHRRCLDAIPREVIARDLEVPAHDLIRRSPSVPLESAEFWCPD